MARIKESKENQESMLDWEEVSKQLSSDDINKGFNAKKFNGTLKVNEDALVIQKRLRDEWK